MAVIQPTAAWTEIPHEPGNELNLAALTWGQLKEAKKARSSEAIASMREMGGDLVQALPNRDTADRMITEALADPLDSFSIATLLEEGVKGWRGPAYDAHEFNINLLDERTAEWAARAVYRMSRIEGDDAGKSRGSSAPTTEDAAEPPIH
jgi:hypothetical protein